MGAPPNPRNSEYFQEYPVLLSKLLGDFPNLSEKFPVVSLNQFGSSAWLCYCHCFVLGTPVPWGLRPRPADAVQPQLVVA